MKKIVIPILCLILLPSLVLAANDLTFDADTTINLSTNNINLTVVSGSRVDSMTINPTNVQFTLSSESTLTVRSTDKYELNDDQNIGYNCLTAYSEITVTGPASGTTDVTITPSTNTCTTPGTGLSSSGGGGGGGAGAAPTPTPTTPPTTTGQVTITVADGGSTTATTAEDATAAADFPANAVTASTIVKITPTEKATVIALRPLPINKSMVGGYAYNYTATRDSQDITSFSKNVTLTFTYTDSQVSGFKESTLRIYYWKTATSEWSPLVTTINTATNTLTVTINHFTYFAILGDLTEEEVEEVVIEGVTLADGDLIRNPNAAGLAQFDIYIVKLVGDKKFKRLIISPHVFESYEHFDKNGNGSPWDDVVEVNQATLDSLTTSDIVRADIDYKVYKLSAEQGADTGVKQWLNMTIEEFETAGYDWDSIYIINATDRDAYTTGTQITISGQVTETTESTATIIIKVTNLRVRSLPSLDGTILTTVHQGETYNVLDEQNGWYQITTTTGITGWCYGGETGGYAAKQ